MPDQIESVKPGPAVNHGELNTTVLDSFGLLLLRGRSSDFDFISSVEAITDCTLPTEPFSSSARSDNHILWLSPDKWLLVTDLKKVGSIQEALRTSLKNSHAAITDISDGMVSIQVAGPGARELMMRCGTLDFNSGSFTLGKVMRAGFVDTTAIYYLLTSEPPCFNLYVPRSYGNYALEFIFNITAILRAGS